MLRDCFKKTQPRSGKEQQSQVPEGMFVKCDSCKKLIFRGDINENFHCCPQCGRHFRIDPYLRLEMVADAGSFTAWDEDLTAGDPLGFDGYQEKLETVKKSTGLKEAVLTGKASIKGVPVAVGIMSADFLMGSMGSATGEKITRMIERATRERLPVLLFCASGGARMQEGILSLMQMAKTAQALKKHDEAGLLYISVLTDPTMGGVTASFAMLGDVILAEPGARIGFAGARVIAQTIGGKLPEGFQSAESMLSHGFVDRIVSRKEMRKVLAVLLRSSQAKA
jgi:acetyl-CoA carboxylase carboxyl transferase subunit beta